MPFEPERLAAALGGRTEGLSKDLNRAGFKEKGLQKWTKGKNSLDLLVKYIYVKYRLIYYYFLGKALPGFGSENRQIRKEVVEKI